MRAAGVPLVEGLSLERTARPWRLACPDRQAPARAARARDRRGPRPPDPRPLAGGAGAPWHQGPTGPHRAPSPGRARRAGRPLAPRADRRADRGQRGHRGAAARHGGPRPVWPSCRAPWTRSASRRRCPATPCGSSSGSPTPRGRLRRADGAGPGSRHPAACGGASPRPPARGPPGAGGPGRASARPRAPRARAGARNDRRLRGLSGRRPAGGPGRARLRRVPGDGIRGVLPGRPRGDGRGTPGRRRPRRRRPGDRGRRGDGLARRAGARRRRGDPRGRAPRSGARTPAWARPDAAAWRRTSPRRGARRSWRPSTPGCSPKKRFPAGRPPV